MPAQALRLGIVGCGVVAETRHLPTLARLAGAEVVAVADVDGERARRVARQFGVARHFDRAEALLDDREVEAVAVCVPPEFHAGVALAALDAGKHAVIEKPMTLTLEDADRLCARAEAFRGAVLMGFNMRWHRLVRRTRAAVREGRLGPIELVRTVFTSAYDIAPEWRRRRAQGGGALFELGIHHFDLWRDLLGAEVDHVLSATRSGECDDETVVVAAQLGDGVLVSSAFSQRAGETNEIEILGRAGRLHLSCYDFDGWSVTPAASAPGSAAARLRRVAASLGELPAGAARMARGGDFFGSYAGMWRHFLAAVRGEARVECSVGDGRRALEIALAAAASAALGRPVKIGDLRDNGAIAGAAQTGGARRASA